MDERMVSDWHVWDRPRHPALSGAAARAARHHGTAAPRHGGTGALVASLGLCLWINLIRDTTAGEGDKAECD